MIELGIGYLPYEKIAEISNNFLLEHNCYKTIPIPIEYIIEYHLRLDIVPMPNLQRDFDIDGQGLCYRSYG